MRRPFNPNYCWIHSINITCRIGYHINQSLSWYNNRNLLARINGDENSFFPSLMDSTPDNSFRRSTTHVRMILSSGDFPFQVGDLFERFVSLPLNDEPTTAMQHLRWLLMHCLTHTNITRTQTLQRPTNNKTQSTICFVKTHQLTCFMFVYHGMQVSIWEVNHYWAREYRTYIRCSIKTQP